MGISMMGNTFLGGFCMWTDRCHLLAGHCPPNSLLNLILMSGSIGKFTTWTVFFVKHLNRNLQHGGNLFLIWKGYLIAAFLLIKLEFYLENKSFCKAWLSCVAVSWPPEVLLGVCFLGFTLLLFYLAFNWVTSGCVSGKYSKLLVKSR